MMKNCQHDHNMLKDTDSTVGNHSKDEKWNRQGVCPARARKAMPLHTKVILDASYFLYFNVYTNVLCRWWTSWLT